MHILVLSPEYLPSSGGGIVTFYRHSLPAYVKAGHSVRIIQGSGVAASVTSRRSIIEGVETETLEQHRLSRFEKRFTRFNATPELRRHLAAAWAMWEQAEEGRGADVIEACDWGLSFIPAVLAGTKPVVVQAHGSIGQVHQHDPIAGEDMQGSLSQLIELTSLARATELQTYSEANAALWRRQVSRDVAIVRPAWRPLPSSVDEPLSQSGLVVGRIQRWKGPHVLCDALAMLGSAAPPVTWVGRDTAIGRRGQSCSATLASEFPKIWGSVVRPRLPVSPDEAARLQRAARFIVVPSTWDVFNFTCVEAMASGRPVICSSRAGASELIQDGVNGFVFESGDAQALAAAIKRVMALTAKAAAEVGAAAQETVSRELDPDRVVATRLARYESLIAKFKPYPAPNDDWLRAACSGRDEKTSNLAFLDHMPLKPLLSYGARRLTSKILSGARG